jgi:GNAT superfamily N-acetyltransferase
MLFDACKNWLKEKGMEAMDGPINFGDRDKWWGLQVYGFDKAPNYNCNYHFPYYQQFFENYGFETYFEQFTFARKTMDPFNPQLKEKAERIFKNPRYSFRHMRLKEIEKYTDDFRVVYNKAWGAHKGVPQLSEQMAKHLMKQMKPIIDEKIMWFGYYDDEPIAMFITLPEVNQIFKHVNGKLDLIGKLKFVYHKWRKTCNKMFGVVFGIVPEHQGKGVEGALIESTRQLVQGNYRAYENFEMNWIGDFNPRMIHVVNQVGSDKAKVHKTYRYLFDRSKPFKRHPMIS